MGEAKKGDIVQYNQYVTQYSLGEDTDSGTYAYVRGNPVSLTDIFGLDCTCNGQARVLQGNSRLIGRSGGFSTPRSAVSVTADSAAVIPAQFGGKGALRPHIGEISATTNGQPLFNGVTDVIGGASPIPGLNVRDALRELNPNVLIIELPGAERDLGTIPIELTVPDGVNCPEGTSPAGQ